MQRTALIFACGRHAGCETIPIMDPSHPPRRKLTLGQTQGAVPGEPMLVSPQVPLRSGVSRAVDPMPDLPGDADNSPQRFFEACGGRSGIALAVRQSEGSRPSETHLFQ